MINCHTQHAVSNSRARLERQIRKAFTKLDPVPQDPHPHVQNKDLYKEHNAIYVANSAADCGTFKYSDELVLTKNGYLKSVWSLPRSFMPAGVKKFSRHKDTSFEQCVDHVMLQTIGIGQDFVVSNNPEAAAWANALIARNQVI